MRSKLKALLETSTLEALRWGATGDDQRQTICIEFAPLSDLRTEAPPEMRAIP